MVLWEVPMWQIRACSAWCWIISTTVFWYQDARTAQDSSNHLLPKHLRFPPQKRGSHNHNLIWFAWIMMIAFYSSPLHQADQQRENSMKNWDWGPNKDFYGMFSKYSQQKLQFSNIFPCHRILSESCQRPIMWQQVDPICPVPTNRGLPHLPVIIRATTTALLELSSFACFLEIQIFLSGVFCPKQSLLIYRACGCD